eukprot:534391-Pleurochrysis_carterae.AAC.1
MMRRLRLSPMTSRGLSREPSTLANTPGMDSCNTPVSAAAMHANPTPRTTRVTRTAHDNGARLYRRWSFGRTALHLHA